MPAERAKKLPLGRGAIGFSVSNTYAAPARKVWDAITKARHVQRFFVDKVEGDFTPELKPVVWEWKKWGRFTLWPSVVQEGRKLEFRWPDHKNKYLTTVAFALKRKGKLTEVEIRERGWIRADLNNAFDNCGGWTMFLDYLKAYLAKGIDLRAH